MEKYDGPFEGYYFSQYHPNFVNKRYKSLDEIINLGVKANITKHKMVCILLEKNNKLLKSPKGKNTEISWR